MRSSTCYSLSAWSLYFSCFLDVSWQVISEPHKSHLNDSDVKLTPKKDLKRRELTSRVSKFRADCGFLMRDSSFFSRPSTLLSAPGMMTGSGSEPRGVLLSCPRKARLSVRAQLRMFAPQVNYSLKFRRASQSFSTNISKESGGKASGAFGGSEVARARSGAHFQVSWKVKYEAKSAPPTCLTSQV